MFYNLTKLFTKISYLFLFVFITNSCGDKYQTNSKGSSKSTPPLVVNSSALVEFFKNDEGNLHQYFKVGSSKEFVPSFYFCVPEDGNSLFNALALAYLIKVRKDDDQLRKRFLNLFSNPDSGDKKDIIESQKYETTLNFIKNLKIDNFSMISINDPKWEELLNRFRKKVNWFIEDNDELYRKFYNSADNPDNNPDKKRSYEKLLATTSFEDYKAKTKINGAYVGWIHIMAIAYFLIWDHNINIIELKKNIDEFIHSKYETKDNPLDNSITLIKCANTLQFGIEL